VFERDEYKPSTTPNIAADYANVNTIFIWSQITCGGLYVAQHVANEPKAVIPNETGTFGPISLEWRCTGVSAAYQRGQDIIVTWSFFGVEKWLGLFYMGGTGAYTL